MSAEDELRALDQSILAQIGQDNADAAGKPKPADTADAIGAGFAALGAAAREAGEDRVKELLARQGYVGYRRPEAIEKFAELHPDWVRTEVGDETQFRPPVAATVETKTETKPVLTQALLDEEFDRAAGIIDRAEADLERGSYRNPLDLQDSVPKLVDFYALDKKYDYPKELENEHIRLMRALRERLAEYEVKYNQAMDSAGRTVPPRAEAAADAGSEPAKTLEGRLGKAREDYAKAQKRFENAQGTFGIKGHLRKDSKKKVEAELAAADAEYKKLRAEFVGAKVENYLEEQDKLLELQLKEHQQKGLLGRGYDKFKSLNTINLEWAAGKLGHEIKSERGKKLARMVNVRTVASFALLGVAVVSGAGIVGGSAMVARRLLSGVGSGVGSYDLMNLGRMKLGRRAVEKELKRTRPENINPLDLDQEIAAVAAQALLDGKKISDLKNDEFYQRLITLRKEAFSREFVDRNAAGRGIDFDKLSSSELAEYDRLTDKDREIRIRIEAESTSREDFISKLEQDPEYLLLVQERNRWHDAKMVTTRPEEFAKFLETKTQESEQTLKRELKSEKRARRATGVVAGALGAAVGSGMLARLIRGEHLSEATGARPVGASAVVQETRPSAPSTPTQIETAQPAAPSASTPEVSHGANTPEATSQPASSATVETQPTSSVQRGIDEIKPTPDGQKIAEVHTAATEPTAAEAPAAEAKLAMRAGATLEMKGDTALIQAGGRGIEGALLDLKDAKPETYAKMIEKLHAAYPDFKGNDGGLVHKYMAEFAQKNGYTIDAEGKDLSRIFKAGIEIGNDGEIKIPTEHNIEFMPEKAASTATDTTASASEPVSMPEAPDSQFKLPKVDLGAGKTVAKNLYHADFKGTGVAQAAEVSDAANGAGAVELVGREAAAEALAQGGRLNTAVQMALGPDLAKDFLQDELHISARSLNKIYNMDVNQFLQQKEQLGKPYLKFARVITKLVADNPALKAEKMSELILDYANEWKELVK